MTDDSMTTAKIDILLLLFHWVEVSCVSVCVLVIVLPLLLPLVSSSRFARRCDRQSIPLHLSCVLVGVLLSTTRRPSSCLLPTAFS